MTDMSPVDIYQSTFNLVGVSYKTLPVEQREALTALGKGENSILKSVVLDCELREAAVISTCNRFEVISIGEDREDRICDFILRQLKADSSSGCIYRYRNSDAVRHLLRVSASLDSMVLGEAQILGQVKDAYQQAVHAGHAGRYLHHLFQFAFQLAKKVRSNTSVAEKGVSVSYVGVKLAEQIFGSLIGRSVMVIGSGQMAELAALHLRNYGCNRIIVANRTIEKAAELASRIGGSAIALNEIESHLPEVDVVIGSITADQSVIQASTLKAQKRSRALFLIDLGVPRNFSPALGEVDDVYLYNIDDLSAIADENRSLREEAARDAEIIIDYGLFQFERWLIKVSAQPAALSFRNMVQSVCAAELRDTLRNYERMHKGKLLSELNPELYDTLVSGLSEKISAKVSHELTSSISRSPGGKLEAEDLLPLLFEDFLKLMR